MSVAHNKKKAMFQRAIAQIITEEVYNANLSYPTVTDVTLSNDLSHLKVFLTFTSRPTRSLEALERSKGFIRSLLAKRVNLRKVPELHFEIDKSAKEGARIDEILTKIKQKEK